MPRPIPPVAGFLGALILTVISSPAVGANLERRTTDGRFDARVAPWAPGEVVVRFRPGVPRSEARALHVEMEGRAAERLDRGVDLVRVAAGTSVMDADVDVYVWSPGTVEIWQLEQGCFARASSCRLRAAGEGPDGREEVRFTGGRGVHYFQVTAFGAQRGRYTLRIRPAPNR